MNLRFFSSLMIAYIFNNCYNAQFEKLFHTLCCLVLHQRLQFALNGSTTNMWLWFFFLYFLPFVCLQHWNIVVTLFIHIFCFIFSFKTPKNWLCLSQRMWHQLFPIKYEILLLQVNMLAIMVNRFRLIGFVVWLLQCDLISHHHRE